MRDVLPEIERRMVGDHPERPRQCQMDSEIDKIAKKTWQEGFLLGTGSDAAAADFPAYGVGPCATEATPAAAQM